MAEIENRPDMVGDGWDDDQLLNDEQVAAMLYCSPTLVHMLPITRIAITRTLTRWRAGDVRAFIRASIPVPSDPIVGWIDLNAADVRVRVLKVAEDYRPRVGIYFLLRSDEVVYVGQSRANVDTRLATHWSNQDKDWDRSAFLDVEEWFLDAIEQHFIDLLDPEYNGGKNDR